MSLEIQKISFDVWLILQFLVPLSKNSNHPNSMISLLQFFISELVRIRSFVDILFFSFPFENLIVFLLYYLSTRVQGGYATSGASLAFH
jgi:hypothetical protein